MFPVGDQGSLRATSTIGAFLRARGRFSFLFVPSSRLSSSARLVGAARWLDSHEKKMVSHQDFLEILCTYMNYLKA